MEQFRHIPTDKDLEKIVNGVMSKKENPKINYKALAITMTAIAGGIVVYNFIKEMRKRDKKV